MLRATLKGMAARKARLTLTGIAVVLGTAFIAAALVLTASIESTVNELSEERYAEADILVQAPEPENVSEQLAPAGVPGETVAAVAATDGVAAVAGTVTDVVNAIGDDGKIVGVLSPTMAVNWGEMSAARELREGRAPESDDEAAVSAKFVADSGLDVGDTVTAYTTASEKTEYTIVGVYGYPGGRDSLSGGTELAFTTTAAQRLVYGGQDAYTAVAVEAAVGTTEAELIDRLAEVVGEHGQVRTKSEVTEETEHQTAEMTGLIGNFLLGFGAVAAFVAVFIIANTFSIVIAGRLKEVAMMRAIGAGRGQITGSVLIEALTLGTAASLLGAALGVIGGLGVARAASSAFFDTAEITTVVPAGSVIAALAVGIGVTVLSALVPALRASRIPPIEALRDAAKADKPITGITVAASTLTAAGAALITLGLTERLGEQNLAGAAVGVGAVFIGMTLLTPWLSRPLVNLIGLSWSWSFSGRLGRRNAARNPRRTAVTADALMIGIALVTATATVLTSAKASLEDYFSDNVQAELFVTGPLTAAVQASFDPAIMDQLRAVEGVEAVADSYYDIAMIDGAERHVTTGSDLDGLIALFGGTVAEGSVSDLREDEIALDAASAESAGVGMGDTVTVLFSRGEQAREFTVAAILSDNDNTGGWYVTQTYAEEFYTPKPTLAIIDVADGADIAAVTAGIETVIAAEPEIGVHNHDEYLAQVTVLFDFAIIAIQLLLGLAIVVAVIGVVNTLVLSVLERTRELGMLRAIGMTKGQTIRMVTAESVTIAVFGALLGIGVGLGLGWALQQALRDEGVEVFAVPTEMIIGYLAAAVLVGLLAAIAPAARAAKVDILGAVAYE